MTFYPGDSSLTTLGTVTSGNETDDLIRRCNFRFESTNILIFIMKETTIHTSEWILGIDDGSNHYVFTGPGHLTGSNDPAIYLTRGQKYRFTNKSGGHPFRIQSQMVLEPMRYTI